MMVGSTLIMIGVLRALPPFVRPAIRSNFLITSDKRISTMSGPGLSTELIKKFQADFDSSDKNRLAQNVCAAHPLWEMLADRKVKQSTQHCFNHKIETEGKPITDQKSSGRCWIYACLNIMRVPFMKKYKMEEFEFSQSYLFFWDKVERANYLLNAFVECAKKGETYEGRLIRHLLFNPSEDGGQWDMLTNLVEKHGVVPKSVYPDSASSENSRSFGKLINNRLREYCMTLCKLVEKKSSDAEIEAEKTKMMGEIYQIACTLLGTPPATFTYQYYTKDDDKKTKYECFGPISPRDFYHQHIKPDILNMEDLVCIVNDPRSQNAYNKLYTVEYLGNMTGGKPVIYVNKPVQELKELAMKAIKDEGTPVWFGCDVVQYFSNKDGFLDLNTLDFKLMFDIDTLKMKKDERLKYCESWMTHAMVLTAVQTKEDKEGQVTGTEKWRVENSWGGERGDKGYLVMTDDWFSEFVYEVVIDKKLLDKDTLDLLEKNELNVLPAWDPMGALARC